jgi:anti-sigma factor RsiW
VRCCSFELLLDRYVEGTLPPRTMVEISTHLRSCPICQRLVTELRVVDALLATTKAVEIAPNFTFAVMAETRSIRLSPARPPMVWAWLSFYLVAAWLVTSGAIGIFHYRVPMLFTDLASARVSLVQFLAAAGAASHAVSTVTPVAVALVTIALLMDAMLALAIIFFHRTVRPRVAERLRITP